MFKLDINQNQITEAQKMSAGMGALNNSITSGEGNVVGFLGEIVVRDYYGGISANTYDYDLIIKDVVKVDVKTKKCTSPPRDYYECSVAGFNTSQKCDAYIFVRILKDLSAAWVLGYKGKTEYYAEAVFHKKGEYDPDNRFTFHCDSYNLRISQLNYIS